MPTPPRAKVLGRYVERSNLVGSVLLIAAVGLVVASAFVSGVIGVLLASFGSAIGTVAVLSLLYDAYLKDLLVSEIFEKLGVRDSIVRTGLVDILPAQDYRSLDLLDGAETIEVLPIMPIEWAQRDFAAWLRTIGLRKVTITVLLPPCEDGAVFDAYAARLGEDPRTARLQLGQLPGKIVEAWDRYTHHPDASLQVRVLAGQPMSGWIATDRVVALEMAPSLGFVDIDRETYVHIYRTGSSVSSWLDRQRTHIGASSTIVELRPVSSPASIVALRETLPHADAEVSEVYLDDTRDAS